MYGVGRDRPASEANGARATGLPVATTDHSFGARCGKAPRQWIRIAMADFAFVCKSYRRDVLRVRRLLDSLAGRNPERIPVVVIVPREDAPVFREALAGLAHELACDEDVVLAHPQASARRLLERYRATAGHLTQQVVKAEAWRLLGCPAYLCMDSDTVFLRPARSSDFLSPSGHPYTLLHQSRELLQLALNRGKPKVVEAFRAESRRLKAWFGREGPDYDFGPQPLIWSARVWADLHDRFLAPRDWTLWDAIAAAPAEIRWYGEALLAYQSVPLLPIEPLFRVYHYDWQWLVQRRQGETEHTLAENFLGVVYQSNWEYELDPVGERSRLSKLSRQFKRLRHRWQAIR